MLLWHQKCKTFLISYLPPVKLIHFPGRICMAWLNERSRQMCLFLQFTLNADELLESSSCFQGTKRSTFIQHFPVHQEKELELCRIVLLNTTAWYFWVVLLKIMNIRDNLLPLTWSWILLHLRSDVALLQLWKNKQQVQTAWNHKNQKWYAECRLGSAWNNLTVSSLYIPDRSVFLVW